MGPLAAPGPGLPLARPFVTAPPDVYASVHKWTTADIRRLLIMAVLSHKISYLQSLSKEGSSYFSSKICVKAGILLPRPVEKLPHLSLLKEAGQGHNPQNCSRSGHHLETRKNIRHSYYCSYNLSRQTFFSPRGSPSYSKIRGTVTNLMPSSSSKMSWKIIL